MNQPDTFRPLRMGVVDIDGITRAAGLTEETAMWAQLLADEYAEHTAHNEMLRGYYDGRVKVSDYGSKADVPNDQTCHWPAKAVDALADRITLERFNAPED
jgi:hypothetical protein